MRFLLLCLLLTSSLLGKAQSVGLFQNSPEAFDGYTLVAPTSAMRTHLIDNCGRVINEWDSDYRTGQSAYLLEDGSLLRTARLTSTVFNGGGIGGRVERFNWEGDLLWSFEVANDTLHHHHDVAWLPNGHVVLLCWEYKSQEEAAAAGRLGGGPLWPPMLMEVAPEGLNGGTIVWEWHLWDHLVQDADSALPHFGNPALNVNRFDVNFGQASGGGLPGGNDGGDWLHCNAVDYNPALDQLVINSRNWNEFFIIDHATSTATAAGPAGDILYRWGNPQTHGRGDEEDRIFFQQHDAHWLIGEGPTANGDNAAWTMLVYNNGNGRPGGDGSSVDELVLPWDSLTGSYIQPPADDPSVSFGPAALDWTWPAVPSMNFHSNNISGSQRQPNGNTLICEGNKGRIFEITTAGEIVWEYVTAYNQFGPVTQGENPFGNATFRAYRYAAGYPAFEGKELTPGPPVEINPTNLDCVTFPEPVDPVDTNETTGVMAHSLDLLIGPNPADHTIALSAAMPFSWSLTDAAGRTVMVAHDAAKVHSIDVTQIPAGMLLLHLCNANGIPLVNPKRLVIQH